ncbi:DNA-3-methyladenine glycosylase family protein [Ihubacter sp. rT4E-8]|uniref:DNA-3-methyladenine glycosylase family protein n=1 Tax=unclassified Ihubacter TaxID=2633299 RepID=UPI003C7C9200
MKYVAKNVKDFHLDHIFDCGQCFRWKKNTDGSYTGTAKGKIANIRYEEPGFDRGTAVEAEAGNGEGNLIIDNCTEEEFQNIWRQYLDLDRDYGRIKKKLSKGDAVMRKAIRNGDGIRILQQDLWETILSFIISQNNHIPRIKGCIEKLAELFGQPIGTYEDRVWYDVPGPEVLASLTEADLAEVRLGYRSKYILGTARAVVQNGLPQNAEQLAALQGVGPKVAACILLFGMGKHEAFPIDVWMARVMHQLYGLDEKDHQAMKAYAEEHFGALGGFAQQYLFYYIRSMK